MNTQNQTPPPVKGESYSPLALKIAEFVSSASETKSYVNRYDRAPGSDLSKIRTQYEIWLAEKIQELLDQELPPPAPPKPPIEVTKALDSHFSPNQAFAIAAEVYQPLLDLIEERMPPLIVLDTASTKL